MPDGSYFNYPTGTYSSNGTEAFTQFSFWFGDTRSTIALFPIPEDWVAGNYNVEWKYYDNGPKYSHTS